MDVLDNTTRYDLNPTPPQMSAVSFGERLCFALERDDVRDRLEFVLRDKTRRQRLAVQMTR
jgi:hypothetical protein